MTIEAANALFRYFEALYDLNRNLITLCGVDVLDNAGHYEKYIESVIHAVPQLLPYTFNKSTRIYEIDTNDGLLEFSDELTFLECSYKSILQKHYSLLAKIKKIRNRFEHRMHGANVVASGSGSISLFDVIYEIDDQDFDLNASEIIALVKDINGIFSKIQKETNAFVYKQKEEWHPYYRRLVRYDFSDFNKIYENDLLRTFGKALLPF